MATETIFELKDGTTKSFNITGEMTNIVDAGFFEKTELKNIVKITLGTTVTGMNNMAHNNDGLNGGVLGFVEAYDGEEDPNHDFYIMEADSQYNFRRRFFPSKNLKEVVFHDTFTNLGYGAFFGCFGLESMNIPGTVTNVGSGCFYQCLNLKQVLFLGQTVSFQSSIQQADDSGGQFLGCINLEYVKLPPTINETSLPLGFFANCQSLKSVVLPKNITSIKAQTFLGTGINIIRVPDGVTSIGYAAFGNCQNLKQIILPDSLTSIGDAAFYGCSSLKYLHLPYGKTSTGTTYGVTTLGQQVFTGAGIKKLKIPPSVTKIGNMLCFGADSLEIVDLFDYDAPPTLGIHAFADKYGNPMEQVRLVIKPNLQAEFKNATNWTLYSNNYLTALLLI